MRSPKSSVPSSIVRWRLEARHPPGVAQEHVAAVSNPLAATGLQLVGGVATTGSSRGHPGASPSPTMPCVGEWRRPYEVNWLSQLLPFLFFVFVMFLCFNG